MAELQTVAAVLDLLKVTYEAGKFLKKVRDADRIAGELETRIKRLHDVLKGVETVLENREDYDIATDGNDADVAARINETIGSCTDTLVELQTKLGGFTTDQQKTAKGLKERVQIALRQPSINRISTELEARIQILSTDLSVLQFFDQTRTSSNINANHDEVLGALSTLGGQVGRANDLLNELMRAHHEFTALGGRRISATSDSDEPLRDISQDAIERLTECLRAAEDVHKTYTSEYLPDDRSIFQHEFSIDSPMPIQTPASRRLTEPSIPPDVVPNPLERRPDATADGLTAHEDDEEDDDVMPLSIINGYIAGYVERAHKELEAGHFNQAEVNLNHAIRYSLTRESRYGVPFDNRADLEEELAIVYSKQRKWGEAVMKVATLLRERTGSSADNNSDEHYSMTRARQNQLLASIYFERHMSNSGSNALSVTTEDIENAERHARRAFKSRWNVMKKNALPVTEGDRHVACIQLLVRILESEDKTVEANELSALLPESVSDGANRPPSTVVTRSEEESVVEVDKHDLLVDAIKQSDSEQINSLLSRDLNLERFCKQRKTFLMHAIEQSDESVVHKLLDPEVGAEVNTANRRGLTALHYAVAGGHHDMIHCLLQHDADINLQDDCGETPVVKAVCAGDEKAVRILVHHDETALEMKGNNEWSLLHFAVSSRQPDMAILLLNLQPELAHAVDQVGQTALHHCVGKERYDQVAALLKHSNRPDVNAVDSINRTPLTLAASKVARPEREDLVRLLLDNGADITVGRPGSRAKDYEVLRRQRRDSTLSRTSVSTSGTVGTSSTSTSRLSRFVGRGFGRG